MLLRLQARRVLLRPQARRVLLRLQARRALLGRLPCGCRDNTRDCPATRHARCGPITAAAVTCAAAAGRRSACEL
jgi:hypothetical protein